MVKVIRKKHIKLYLFFIICIVFFSKQTNAQIYTINFNSNSVTPLTQLTSDQLQNTNDQDNYDDFDWILESAGTPTTGTGPSAPKEGAYYCFMEATGEPAYNEAILSGSFDLSGVNYPILSFWFHRYSNGENIGKLSVWIYDDINLPHQWKEIWSSFENDLNDEWYQAKICLDDFGNRSNVKIRFKAVTTGDDKADIAIDDIQISAFKLINTSKNDLTCFGTDDGSLSLTVSGGGPNYEYSNGVTTKSSTATTESFTNLYARDYPIQITDISSGCVITGTQISITEPEEVGISTSFTDISCYGSSTGSITITASETNPKTPYQYSVYGKDGAWQTSNSFTNLAGDEYYAIIKNNDGCLSDSVKIHLGENVLLVVDSAVKKDVELCYGDDDGTIKIYARAGSNNTPIYFSIDGGSNYQAGNYFSLLEGSTTYSVVVKDKNNCTTSPIDVTINEPAELTVDPVSKTNILGCYGDNTGEISITAHGGTTPYYYSIDNRVNYDTQSTISNLSAGDYQIYVKDANNCETFAENLTLTQPTQLEITSVSKTNVIGCKGDNNGTITIVAAEGTSPYTYYIDQALTISNSTGSFSNLSPGTYYPSVKDANGCTVSSDAITITEPSEFKISEITKMNIADCYGDNTGIIGIAAEGGSGNYTYTIDDWTNSSMSNNFTDLYAGDYTIQAHDDNNCYSAKYNITLTQPTELKITSQTATPASCKGSNDGSINITTEGGTGPIYYIIDGYTYNNSPINNLYAGTYTIKVKDDNKCITTGADITIGEPNVLEITSVNVTDVSGCFGDENGEIEIVATGGTTPYKYKISTDGNLTTSNVFTNLAAGSNYYPYVIDANGCVEQKTNPTAITQPQQLVITGQQAFDVEGCKGDATGYISVSYAGGTSPISYSVDNGTTWNSQSTIYNLTAGNYNIKIKDVNNCTVQGSQLTINEPEKFLFDSVVVSKILCNDQSNGIIKTYISGGKTPYNYSINGSIPMITSNYSYFGGLSSKTYNIVFKDKYNCQIDTNITLENPDTLIIENITKQDIFTCNGDAKGEINVDATGGTGNLQYSINSYAGPFQDNGNFNNLLAGFYTVVVIDENDCYASKPTFTLKEPTKIEFGDLFSTNITCNGFDDGTITLSAAGGTQPYYYSINNGNTFESTPDFSNLSKGTYNIVIKDSKDCFIDDEKAIIITEPPILKINEIETYNVSCYNYEDGMINVKINGGTGPFLFQINDSEWQSSSFFQNLAPGTYSAKVKDKYACSTQSETVDINMPPDYSTYKVSETAGCHPLTISITKDYSSSTMFYDFGDGADTTAQNPTYTFENLSDTVALFTITGSSYNGNCQDTTYKTITVYPKPKVDFSVDKSLIYYPDTVITINNLSDNDLINYQWDFDDGSTSELENPGKHTYTGCGDRTISVKASDGRCSDSTQQTIQIIPVEPVADFVTDIDQGCTPLQINITNKSENANSYSWDLADGETSNEVSVSHEYTAPGTYLVKLTAFGDCDTKSSHTDEVIVYELPSASFRTSVDTVVPNQAVIFYSSSSNATYYSWNFGDDSTSTDSHPIHTYDNPGTYDVSLIIQTAQGCIDSAVIKNAITVVNNPMIVFPTAFSPNGDGLNDTFFPVFEEINDYEIVITNKKSQVVFESKDINAAWDGTNLLGEPCLPDVYIWKVTARYGKQELFIETGTVTLIR